MNKKFMILCLLAAGLQSCGTDKQKNTAENEAEAPAQEEGRHLITVAPSHISKGKKSEEKMADA